MRLRTTCGIAGPSPIFSTLKRRPLGQLPSPALGFRTAPQRDALVAAHVSKLQQHVAVSR
jgi:hypothetical protein